MPLERNNKKMAKHSEILVDILFSALTSTLTYTNFVASTLKFVSYAKKK